MLQVWFWEKNRADRLDRTIDYSSRETPLIQHWNETKANKVQAVLDKHGREAGEVHTFVPAKVLRKSLNT